jgi:hypothetical protein
MDEKIFHTSFLILMIKIPQKPRHTTIYGISNNLMIIHVEIKLAE